MRNLIWGIILVSIGLLLLFDNLGIADFGEVMHDYWPLILVLWGVAILIKRNNRVSTAAQPAVSTTAQPAPPPAPFTTPDVPVTPPPAQGMNVPPPQPPPPAGTHPNTAAPMDLIHDSNVFGDLHVQVTSKNFKGGSVSTVFGNGIIDLSNAAIAPGDHELRIHAVMGNLTVVLRQGMAVSIAANTFLGDIVSLGQTRSGVSPDILNTTPSFSTSGDRLKITAHTVLGNIRVS